jgi:hypothetical protein
MAACQLENCVHTHDIFGREIKMNCSVWYWVETRPSGPVNWRKTIDGTVVAMAESQGYCSWTHKLTPERSFNSTPFIGNNSFTQMLVHLIRNSRSRLLYNTFHFKLFSIITHIYLTMLYIYTHKVVMRHLARSVIEFLCLFLIKLSSWYNFKMCQPFIACKSLLQLLIFFLHL